jgi:hypothetical protein
MSQNLQTIALSLLCHKVSKPSHCSRHFTKSPNHRTVPLMSQNLQTIALSQTFHKISKPSHCPSYVTKSPNHRTVPDISQNLQTIALSQTFHKISKPSHCPRHFKNLQTIALSQTAQRTAITASFIHAWIHASAAKRVRSALFWDSKQRAAVVYYRHFGTSFPSRRQEPRQPRRRGASSWISCLLTTGPTGCPETSARTLSNLPEERRSQFHPVYRFGLCFYGIELHIIHRRSVHICPTPSLLPNLFCIVLHTHIPRHVHRTFPVTSWTNSLHHVS